MLNLSINANSLIDSGPQIALLGPSVTDVFKDADHHDENYSITLSEDDDTLTISVKRTPTTVTLLFLHGDEETGIPIITASYPRYDGPGALDRIETVRPTNGGYGDTIINVYTRDGEGMITDGIAHC